MRAQPANNLILSAIPWDIFGTLTFRDEPSREKAGRLIDKWLRWVARSSNLNFRSNFYYAVRFERGEHGGRLHGHVLLRVPRFARGFFVVPAGAVCVAHKRWRHGLTRFRYIEASDPALPYFEKPDKGVSGADAYERAKTDFAHDIVFGEAVIRRAMRQKSAPEACVQAVDGQKATLAGLSGQSLEPALARKLQSDSVATGTKIAF